MGACVKVCECVKAVGRHVRPGAAGDTAVRPGHGTRPVTSSRPGVLHDGRGPAPPPGRAVATPSYGGRTPGPGRRVAPDTLPRTRSAPYDARTADGARSAGHPCADLDQNIRSTTIRGRPVDPFRAVRGAAGRRTAQRHGTTRRPTGATTTPSSSASARADRSSTRVTAAPQARETREVTTVTLDACQAGTAGGAGLTCRRARANAPSGSPETVRACDQEPSGGHRRTRRRCRAVHHRHALAS